MNLNHRQWSESDRAAVEQLRRLVRVHGPRSQDGWVPVWTADDVEALDKVGRIFAAHLLIASGDPAVEMRRVDDHQGLWSVELRSLLNMPPRAPPPRLHPHPPDPDQPGQDA